LTTGAIYLTGTLYWITGVMHVYGNLQIWTAVLINVLLVAYQAAFPALFALLIRLFARHLGRSALLAAPLVWVTVELGRTYILTGFPWVLLGYSQVQAVAVAQLASAFGVYGVSALVASVSGALAFAVTSSQGRAGGGVWRHHLVPLGVVVAIIAVVWWWGSVRVAEARLAAAGTAIRVGLVQGNVDQAEKWDPARASAIFESYLQKTRDAIDRGAELVVWPESSTQFLFDDDRPSAERVRALARSAGVPILLGSDQVERGQPTRYYNAAVLVNPDGSTGGAYRKMHLVPFGEYVPLRRLLFFAAPLVETVGDFSAGTEAVLLPVRGRKVSTAICYEVVYPDQVRRTVADGAHLLTTITNDAWFGRTSAPYQHFEQAAMRAIENGRYVVRAANTGVSGIVDPYGRPLVRSGIFEPAVIVGEARFLDEQTLYTRTGDVFAYACAAATLGIWAACTILARQHARQRLELGRHGPR